MVIERNEVVTALEQIKVRKVPGIENIRPEMIKHIMEKTESTYYITY